MRTAPKIKCRQFKPNLVIKILSIFLISVAQISSSAAQGEMRGKVLDEKKEPLLSVTVQVFQGGVLKGGTVTDFDGLYSVKPLEPGRYEMIVTYGGYDSFINHQVVVNLDTPKIVDCTLKRKNLSSSTYYESHGYIPDRFLHSKSMPFNPYDGAIKPVIIPDELTNIRGKKKAKRHHKK